MPVLKQLKFKSAFPGVAWEKFLLVLILVVHELGSTPALQRLRVVCEYFHHLMLLMVKASCLVSGELWWSPVPGSCQKTPVCNSTAQHMLWLDQTRLTQCCLKSVSACSCGFLVSSLAVFFEIYKWQRDMGSLQVKTKFQKPDIKTTFQYFSPLAQVSKHTLVSCPYPWCFAISSCLSVGKNSCGVWSPWRNTW